MLGIVPVSELLDKSLSTKQQQSSVQTNAQRTSHAYVPTHRYASDDSWPTVLRIVPVS
jgi:hypothetical protein